MPSRRTLLFASIACATGFVLVAVLVALEWTTGLDSSGRQASAWAVAHGLVPLLRDIELAFGRTAIAAYMALIAAVLLLRRQTRVAVFVVITTCASTLVTAVLKAALGRQRPPWQVVSHLLTSNSLPSGHAVSMGALAAMVVLAAAHAHRRTAVLVASVIGTGAVVVVDADRVMLGRHFPSDVVAGTLVGAGVACLMAVVLGLAAASVQDSGPDPARPSRETSYELVAAAPDSYDAVRCRPVRATRDGR